MKTIKELNKELNQKTWYRLLKVLWVGAYIILLLGGIVSIGKLDGEEVISMFVMLTGSYLWATVVLKRAVCYAADYVATGKIYLKEKWYSLLFVLLWFPSIIFLGVLLSDFLQEPPKRTTIIDRNSKGQSMDDFLKEIQDPPTKDVPSSGEVHQR